MFPQSFLQIARLSNAELKSFKSVVNHTMLNLHLIRVWCQKNTQELRIQLMSKRDENTCAFDETTFVFRDRRKCNDLCFHQQTLNERASDGNLKSSRMPCIKFEWHTHRMLVLSSK